MLQGKKGEIFLTSMVCTMLDDRLPSLFKETVTRKILYLSLTFVISFAVFFTVDNIQNRTISSYTHKIENQQSRSLLGKSILNRLLMIELEVNKLVDSDEIRSINILYDGIRENLESIGSALNILQHGGTFINSLPANFYEVDEVNEHINFERSPDESYVMEVIELTPKIIELGESITNISAKMKTLIENGEQPDNADLLEQIHIRVMKIEALILRARESASKIFLKLKERFRG